VRPNRKLALAASAVALVAAACGSSSKASSSTSAASSSSAAASSAAQTTAAAAPSSSAPSSSAAAGGPVKLAFITKFPVAFFTAMEDSAKAYAAKNPGVVDITFFSCKTPSDTACQIAQIEDAVAKGFKAVVITPMGVEVVPAMEAAAAKGVKFVLADNNLDAFKGKTAVAATDNVKGGQAAGAYLKTILKSGDSIGLMEGVRGVPALDARIQGVKDALKDTGVKIVIGGSETGCDSAKGATVAEDLLTREPNLNAIYSACDDPAIAAAKVAKDKGKKVIVMGYDGLPDAAKAIQAGDMKATIAQFPGKMAALGVDAAVKAVQGKPVDAFIDTGTELVTTDNAAKFLQFQ
jgi:ABC-type sugar transport system substrate-binding protein